MMSSTCYIRIYTPNTWQSIKVWKNCQVSNYALTHFSAIKPLQVETFYKHSDYVFLSWINQYLQATEYITCAGIPRNINCLFFKLVNSDVVKGNDSFCVMYVIS